MTLKAEMFRHPLGVFTLILWGILFCSSGFTHMSEEADGGSASAPAMRSAANESSDSDDESSDEEPPAPPKEPPAPPKIVHLAESDPEILRQIFGSPLPESLDLNIVGPKAVPLIAEALAQLRTQLNPPPPIGELKMTLSLMSNSCACWIDCSPDKVKHLVEAPSLSWFNLGFDEMKLLAEALPQSNLTSLTLSRPNLGPDAMELLAKALPQSKLTSLSISHSFPTFGDPNAIKLLAAALPRSNLTSLSLTFCNIGKDANILLQYIPSSKIKNLNLCFNRLSDKQKTEFRNLLVKTNDFKEVFV